MKKVWLIKTPKGKTIHVGLGSKSQAWDDASDNYAPLLGIYVNLPTAVDSIKDAIPALKKAGYTCTRGYVRDGEL